MGRRKWRGGLKIVNPEVMKTMEKQSEIIKLQADIIDGLAIELLQGGLMTETDLQKIKKAATMQEKLLE